VPFGERLLWLRVTAGLTQEELAGRSRVSVNAISALENGRRRNPRTSTITMLASGLDLAPDERERLEATARVRRPSPALPVESQPRPRPPEPRAAIPPDPTAHFVGREAELAEVRQLLQRAGRVAIHGLGGVGKSQLALHYLHTRRLDYPDGAFWLRADHETSLVGDLASLAWRLRLPEREEPSQERQVEAVLWWLRQHTRWLLVLDDLEPSGVEALRRWLPPGLPGHLLLTSRTPIWPARLGLEPLPVEVARRFLVQRTGQVDPMGAAAVTEALGGLPLALEQAAAYLQACGRDLAGYAELLRTHLVQLMEDGKPEGYPQPVATTWQLSFQRVEEECPAAAALLRLCAFLAPDDIPVGVLMAGAGALPEELGALLGDGVELDRAVAALGRYSLLLRQGDGVQVHRLVQAVIRESLPADQWESWLAAAIRLLRSGFPQEPQDQPELWPLCARLLAHVQVVEHLAGDGTVEPRALGWLLDRIGLYLWARGEFEPASRFHQRALAIREQALGPGHPDTAESLNDLGGVLWAQGDLGAARSLVECALEIRQRTMGLGHPDTAESLNHLAILLQAQGELARARPLAERALAIREEALGASHPDTAESLNDLASLLRDQGESALARPYLERALTVREQVLGREHPDTATTLNNLAMVLRDQGELAAARPLIERALAIGEKVLGTDHPSTAITLNQLGLVLRRQGELAASRSVSERALAICERVLGPDHPLTANSTHNLAAVLHDQGELAAARSLQERAVAAYARTLGQEHAYSARSLHRLAILLRDEGDLVGARALLERTVVTLERTLSPEHRWSIDCRRALKAVTAELKSASSSPLSES
jgi:tetratricopeptide (TPR) repeat protein/transcriptional regulator with XRE-family HTH domain